jgi:hypothetical protein
VTVYVLPKHAVSASMAALPVFDVTTHGTLARPLSPMLLGPVPLYGGLWSRTVENAWQYSKVYREHIGPDGSAGREWWSWARDGWDNPRAVRYPMGRGARPQFSLWAGDQLGYVLARRRIYIPLYAHAVRFYQLDLFRFLRQQACAGDTIITDFDAYDHRALGYTWDDVISDPDRRMGHGFVLAMMLEGVL